MNLKMIFVLFLFSLFGGCGGGGGGDTTPPTPQVPETPVKETPQNNIPVTLVTYPALPANQYQSDRYKVEVSQNGGTAKESYVYKDLAPTDLSPTADYAAYNYYSKANHFTTFSFSGSVTVKVTLPLRTTPITTAYVRPLSKGITPTIDGNVVTFTLDSAANVFVDIPDETRQPLFVFANPMEVNVPAPTDANVYYFGPGVHDIGTSGSIYQNLPAGSTVYLAGGAFVKGSFQRDNQIYDDKTYGGTLTVRGRGILSHIGLPRYPSATAVSLIASKYGSVNVEGIIMTDMTGFAVESYYGRANQSSTVDNVKIFGWYSHADGPHVGPYGIVKNCFLKTGDDNLFAYYNNQQVLDNTVWQQQSAIIQLGWNLVNDTTNMTVRGLDVIGSDMAFWHPPSGFYDTALIAMHNLEGANYSGLTIQDVRVESTLLQAFAMQTKQDWANKPLVAGLGTVKGITLKNIHLAKTPNVLGVFNGNGTSTGEISDVTFDNVTIAGTRLNASNASSHFVTQGNTSGFKYY